jgi:hypothetical protein
VPLRLSREPMTRMRPRSGEGISPATRAGPVLPKRIRRGASASRTPSDDGLSPSRATAGLGRGRGWGGGGRQRGGAGSASPRRCLFRGLTMQVRGGRAAGLRTRMRYGRLAPVRAIRSVSAASPLADTGRARRQLFTLDRYLGTALSR